MPVVNGVIFVVEKCEPGDITDDISLAVINDIIFLKCRDIYSFLNNDIIRHLETLVESHDSINISWYYSGAEEYKIDYGFTLSLNRFNCSKLITMYDLEEQKIQKKIDHDRSGALNIESEVQNEVFQAEAQTQG